MFSCKLFIDFHQGPPRTIRQGARLPLHKWSLLKSAPGYKQRLTLRILKMNKYSRLFTNVNPPSHEFSRSALKTKDKQQEFAFREEPAQRNRAVDRDCDKLAVDSRRYCQLVDRRRSSLSRSERPHLSSKVNNTVQRSMCHAWRNFPGLEFRTVFQREVLLSF